MATKSADPLDLKVLVGVLGSIGGCESRDFRLDTRFYVIIVTLPKLEENARMPSVSEKQRRFFGAELGRARAGKKTRTSLRESQLRDFARKKRGRKI